MCVICYKFEYKQTGRRCSCAWSFLTLLAGAAVFYFTLQLGNSQVFKRVEDNIEYLNEDVRSILIAWLYATAVLIILAGCFGMTFKWMRNKCCTVIYGSLLLPLLLLVLGIGVAAVYIAFTASDEFKKECDTLITDRVEREQEIFAIAEEFATKVAQQNSQTSSSTTESS